MVASIFLFQNLLDQVDQTKQKTKPRIKIFLNQQANFNPHFVHNENAHSSFILQGHEKRSYIHQKNSEKDEKEISSHLFLS